MPSNLARPQQRAAIRLIPAFAAALAIAEFASSAIAAEKKKATPIMAPAPPPAMPQNVRVTRGKAVDIPLRTFGRHSEQLRYVIKSLPAHGGLSEPRVVDREASMVTYEPPADFAVKNDRFLFSVKTSVGVSAPVEVNIAIVDEMPMLDSGRAGFRSISRAPWRRKSSSWRIAAAASRKAS